MSDALKFTDREGRLEADDAGGRGKQAGSF